MMLERNITAGGQTINYQLLKPLTSKRGKKMLWSFPVLIGSERRTQNVSVPMSVELSPERIAEFAADAIGDELREEVRESCSHTWKAEVCERCGVPRVFVEPELRV